MKTGVLMGVYNEATWVKLAIESIKNHFDEIIITEGAYQIAINSGATPRSNDGTLEILEKYKSDPKFTILHINEQDHCFQNNKALEIIKQKNIDWIFIVDGDEIWTDNNIKIIKNFINIGDKKGIYQYWVYFYNFVNSFDQYLEARMRRLYKITPGCEFVNKNENLHWPDHGKSLDVGTPVSHVSEVPSFCKGFHYTEIKNAQRWLLKKEYLQKRDNNPRFKQWKVTDKGVQHDEMHLIKPFTGQHPLVVQEHELYKMWLTNKELYYKTLFQIGDKNEL